MDLALELSQLRLRNGEAIRIPLDMSKNLLNLLIIRRVLGAQTQHMTPAARLRLVSLELCQGDVDSSLVNRFSVSLRGEGVR